MRNCQRFGTHFLQIVEDCVSDCPRLRLSRSRSRNSFPSFNPPRKTEAEFLGCHLQGSHFFGLTKFHDISMIFPGF